MDKGISPLIAAVVLVLFVVAVGTITSQFLGGMTKETEAEIGKKSEVMLDCSFWDVTIDKDSVLLGQTIKVAVENSGKKDVTGLKIVAYNESGGFSFDATPSWLNEGEKRVIAGPHPGGTLLEISVISDCPEVRDSYEFTETLVILDRQIGNGSDNAFQNGINTYTITDLVNFYFHWSQEWGGLRFTDINIPSDAVITTAYLELYFFQDDMDNPSVDIYCENKGNPITFYYAINNLTDRPRTNNSVEWSVWGAGTGWRSSPELKTVVQEVLGRQSGTGDSLVFVLDKINNMYMRIRGFGYGDHVRAPKLHIEYLCTIRRD